MKNKKRIMAVAMAAAMMLTNVAGGILPYVGAAEIGSREEVSSGAGIDTVREMQEDCRTSEDDAVTEENVTIQTMEAETEAPLENREEGEIKGDTEKDGHAEITEEETGAGEENLESDLEELFRTNEKQNEGDKKNYIVLTEEDTDKKELATDIVEIVEGASDDAVKVLEDNIESENLTEENREILDEKGMLLLSIDEDAAKEIEQLDDVIAVEEDIELFSSEEEEDIRLGVETEEVSDWNKEIIKINEVPQPEGNKVKIAILDSGINLIADIDVAKSVNLVEDEQGLDGMFMDGTGHGTAIAGIIAARDDERGITGINPNAEIYSVRILDSNNRCTLSRLIAGIHKAEEMGSDILCMSLGTEIRSVALERAVKEADEKGLLLIAAAGNGDIVEYPAAYDEVVAVGGINPDGRPCTESSEKEEVEILAPGEDVPVTDTFFEAD